jgi:NAD(P)-dependent dehydrogenase (short-subunit alcohol dehydrogenase family)
LRAQHPLGLGEPRDAAALAAFLLSEDAKWITGSVMNLDGGLTSH